MPAKNSTKTSGTDLETRIFTIKGRVQGVWFRDSTRREALKLGVSGYAKNLPKGDVEVLAVGEAAALNELARWLRDGPPMAEVTDIKEEVLEARESFGFQIA
jgi:acylphosphatase